MNRALFFKLIRWAILLGMGACYLGLLPHGM